MAGPGAQHAEQARGVKLAAGVAFPGHGRRIVAPVRRIVDLARSGRRGLMRGLVGSAGALVGADVGAGVARVAVLVLVGEAGGERGAGVDGG